MSLSVLLPTKNNFDKIKHCVKYYSKILNQHMQLFILDSSDEYIYLKQYEFLKNLNCKYIKHLSIEGKSCQVQKKFLDNIDSQYVTFTGDDDYLVIDGIEKCIQFLDKNNEFIAAHGYAYNLTLSSREKNKIININKYNSLVGGNDNQTSLNRIKQQFKNYNTTTFGIHRISNYKKLMSFINLKNNKNENENIFNDELLPNFLSSCYGKMKFINELYLFRTFCEKRKPTNFVGQIRKFIFFKYNTLGKKSIENFVQILAKESSCIDNKEEKKYFLIISKYVNNFLFRIYVKPFTFLNIFFKKKIIQVLSILKIKNFLKKKLKKNNKVFYTISFEKKFQDFLKMSNFKIFE